MRKWRLKNKKVTTLIALKLRKSIVAEKCHINLGNPPPSMPMIGCEVLHLCLIKSWSYQPHFSIQFINGSTGLVLPARTTLTANLSSLNTFNSVQHKHASNRPGAEATHFTSWNESDSMEIFAINAGRKTGNALKA